MKSGLLRVENIMRRLIAVLVNNKPIMVFNELSDMLLFETRMEKFLIKDQN